MLRVQQETIFLLDVPASLGHIKPWVRLRQSAFIVKDCMEFYTLAVLFIRSSVFVSLFNTISDGA